MWQKLAVLLAFDVLIVFSMSHARAEELSPKEAKLVACWQEVAQLHRFTIQEKEMLVRECLAR